jgi:hypothetical protein
MVRLERHMAHTLRAAGGLAAATLVLAPSISCASRPLAAPTASLATPTAPIVVPTHTPTPAPASPEPGSFGSRPGRSAAGPRSGTEPKGRPGDGRPREKPLAPPGGGRRDGGENRTALSPNPRARSSLRPAPGHQP